MTPTRPKLDSNQLTLEQKLDDMFLYTSKALNKSIMSFQDYDLHLAKQVIEEDTQINALEQKVEELGVQTIALQQPVASDLRKLMADIFISMELERIADHTVAIAEILLKLKEKPDNRHVYPISEIAEKCKSMLVLAKQAYDEIDEQLARNVAAMDDEIDSEEHKFNEIMFQALSSNANNAKACTYLLWITHNLERIGDRITNIAERVVYIKTNVTPDLNP